MNYSKPFLPITDQITQLKSRGMIISDEAHAAHYLQHINYVRLRMYWYSFEVDHTTHQFRSDTTFEKVLNLYLFDRALRFHLSRAIETIEISLRTQFAYQFSKQHGAFAYADVAYSRNPQHFENNLRQLRNEIRRSNDVFIVHYLRKYGESGIPPVWMACEVMSFGLLSRWYKNIRPLRTRKAIANAYHVHNKSLAGVLHSFTELRNVIAHHGRLWDRTIIFELPLPRTRPTGLRASMNLTERNTLYNSLVMMFHFLKIIRPENLWGQKLIDLIERYQIETNSMGFPVRWQMLPVWQQTG